MVYLPPVKDFPLLNRYKSLVYLDNAATTQKPQVVLDSIQDYYQTKNANVHRAVHALSSQATQAFEDARRTVAEFIHASAPEEIIWTRGTTESINLVAQSFAMSALNSDSKVVISEMEHHSNIVPWQLLCERVGARLCAAPVLPNGTLDLKEYEDLLDHDTCIVALTHVSNVTGVINPVQQLTAMAHEAGAIVLIDGAQAAPHLDIDVQSIDCDFYAFSGHKMYGPTGIGVLYGRKTLLDRAPPWQGGGEMIKEVQITGSTYQKSPHRFEAGTPHIEGAIGLAAAIDYLTEQRKLGLQQYEKQLFSEANQALSQIDGLSMVSSVKNRLGSLSFLIDGVHPHDLGTLLTEQNIALRTGHHCAMPLMDALSIPSTVRPSLGLYNTFEDIEKLVEAIKSACRILRP
ncbi:MAG: cysteine desulfurase [Gammaproteobacteria bacterium]|nr:cysteine desulfurase [Gammaproteobacteria bacterium]MYF53082.1 cysteine desulfurase [Gammaproteobacteria bacterium]MYK43267.1 cysteine desulfurase [Gammaproteobacteria bacterium]